MKEYLKGLKWNQEGLIPAIAQDESGKVLMLAWMNPQSLEQSLKSGRAVYYSRSRQKLWQKGEESGHFQKIIQIETDCDGDTLLLTVQQTGLACHTGHYSCFFNILKNEEWVENAPVVKEESAIYGK